MRNYIKAFLILLSISVLWSCCPYCGMTPDERAAARLAERIVPGYAEDVVFVQTEDSVDVFELSSEQGKLLIKGNNANWDGTGRPDDYDFAFAWISDTQGYVQRYDYHFDNMANWLAKRYLDNVLYSIQEDRLIYPE